MNAAVLEVREPSAKYLALAELEATREFELLATAQAGISRLRQLILNLAVRGMLMPQIPTEEHAATVLSFARAARAEDTAVRRARQTTRQLDDDADRERRQLPAGWLLVSGADLYRVVRGVSYEKQQASDVASAGAVPLLRANNIQRTLNFDDAVFVPSGLVAAEQLLRAGDYVVCMASGSKDLVGKAASFVEGPTCTFGAFCAAIRPYAGTLAPYLGVFLSSPLYRDEVSAESAGIGINNLKSSTLLSLRLPLPPLAEQQRIVARVEELMKLCDALEQSGRLADEQHARLTSTLFDALAASESADALAENWRRVAEHFDLLLDRPQAIDAFEQVILQLAVRGLLVVGQSEPSCWKETTAGAVLSFLNGYAFKSEWFRSKGVRLVRNVNVAHGALNWTNGACVDDAVAQDMERFALQTGDLVISLDRPLISTGLKYAVVRECDLPCLLLQRVARMAPRAEVLDAAYLELWLQSPAFLGSIDPGRSNGVPHISTRQLEAIPFLLPPLPEQHRIVARVEELRRLCAQLRERLTEARRTQSQLADALVAEAVA